MDPFVLPLLSSLTLRLFPVHKYQIRKWETQCVWVWEMLLWKNKSWTLREHVFWPVVWNGDGMLERSDFAHVDTQLPVRAHSGFRVKRKHLYPHVIPGSVFFLLEIGSELEGCFFPGVSFLLQEMPLKYSCTKIFKTSSLAVSWLSTSLASSSLWRSRERGFFQVCSQYHLNPKINYTNDQE